MNKEEIDIELRKYCDFVYKNGQISKVSYKFDLQLKNICLIKRTRPLYKTSDETRKKISAALTGKKYKKRPLII